MLSATMNAVELAAADRSTGNIATNPDAVELMRKLGKDVNNFPSGKPYSVCIDSVPVTVERLSYYPKPGDKLQDPGTARANIAPSNESPQGTLDENWYEDHKHQTVVQQHCAYWDQDGDGIIWPQDTYRGVRAWGWNVVLSLLAAFIINVNLSYATLPSWIPDPFFRIHIANVHKDKHGSGSMSFDNEGRFRPQNFEDFFAKYDRGSKGGVDVYDLARAWKGQRMAFDFFGWSAAFLEWLATYLLIWPEDGVLRKEDVRRVFDGSIFQHKADEYAAKQRGLGRERKAKKLR